MIDFYMNPKGLYQLAIPTHLFSTTLENPDVWIKITNIVSQPSPWVDYTRESPLMMFSWEGKNKSVNVNNIQDIDDWLRCKQIIDQMIGNVIQVGNRGSYWLGCIADFTVQSLQRRCVKFPTRQQYLVFTIEPFDRFLYCDPYTEQQTCYVGTIPTGWLKFITHPTFLPFFEDVQFKINHTLFAAKKKDLIF